MSEREQVIAYMGKRILEIERVQERLRRVKALYTVKAGQVRDKLYELDALKCSYRESIKLMRKTGQ